MGSMDRVSALALLKTHVKEEPLVRHCIATGAIMKAMAARLGEDAPCWERIGILHDIDFEEINGDMQRHGVAGAEILHQHGIDPDEAEIIRRHNHLLHGDAYTRPVEIVLQAADSSSGLIIACALVKGGRLSDVTTKTIMKKAKEKSFAAGCDRDRIAKIEPVVSLAEFYAIALDGLMESREELGLT
jgi:putative nucleotidyltransferase with HDIG domain